MYNVNKDDFVHGMNITPYRTWTEIDIDSLLHNYKEFKRMLTKRHPGRTVKMMGVVKANAYGHGAVTVSHSLVGAGIDYLAVSSVDEAIELRKADIKVPLLVLNYVSTAMSKQIVEYDLTQTVCNENQANALSEEATCNKKKVNVHIKVDTGMTRMGFNWDRAKEVILRMARFPGIKVEGMFTHFASADRPKDEYTWMQYERFLHLVEGLKRDGLEIPLKHVCNSAGAINYPQMHMDMIRLGIALYGYYPSDNTDTSEIKLQPVMTFKSEVIRINEVDADVDVGYGRDFTTGRKSKIATIPVGYADGLNRLLSGKARVLIHGQTAPIIGRICMDQCMIDISDILGNVGIGDEVVILGTQKGKRILADDIAKLIGTINYEIITTIGRRVPRYYIRKCKIYETENYLLNKI